jgi:hypothetical protein
MVNFVEQVNAIFKIEKIASSNLVSIAADQMIGAINNGKFENFDFIVVNENKDNSNSVCGVINRKCALGEDSSRQVVRNSKHYFALKEELLISQDAGILDYINRADQHPVLLLMGSTKISGIVTPSDLQKIQTRSVFITLFLHFEELLTSFLKIQLGENKDELFVYFSNIRRLKLEEKIKLLTRENLFVDIWCAFDFGDKKTLFVKNKLSGEVSNTDVKKEFKTINTYRNMIAHSSSKKELFGSTNFIEATKYLLKWIERLEASIKI